MKSYYIIAAVVLAAFVALGASSLKSSMTPYVTTFDKVRASSEKIQVPGTVVKEKTASFDKNLNAFVFYVSDPKGEELKVVYTGVKPGNFDQAKTVVSIGQYKDGALHAEQLLVKCPSKYQEKSNE